MNWLHYAFIASLIVHIGWLFVVASLLDDIKNLKAEIERLRGVKTGEAGA